MRKRARFKSAVWVISVGLAHVGGMSAHPPNRGAKADIP